MDYTLLLNEVVRIAEAAGRLLVAEWERPEGPRGSGDKADIDLEIEAQLRPELLALLSCDFWGEETGFSLTGHEYCWVVDPNDGTTDFLKGLKGSAISVGLLRDSQPILGVVYAPVLESWPSDCIAWAKGMSSVQRNGLSVNTLLTDRAWSERSTVMVSAAAVSKPAVNAELCSPGHFVAMPSIAYRLARVAAGDGDVGVSLYPVSAHDVVAGHALLIGAGGVLLDQDGKTITYSTADGLEIVSQRCFGGSHAGCQALLRRDWAKVLR